MKINRLFSAIVVIVSLVAATRAQEVLPPLELPHRDGQGLARIESTKQSETLTVPSETQVSVEMLSGIHTKINRAEDLVTARLVQPVYVNGRVALPSGSILDGHIMTIQNAGFVHRPAKLRLRFDKIVLPDGQAESIAGVIARLDKSQKLDLRIDAEGYLASGRTLSWKALLGGAGIGGFGAIRALASGVTTASMSLSLVGAGVIGYEILLPKGHEVNVPPETHCLVRLNYPLTVKVPW
jgi:hypothetical protein